MNNLEEIKARAEGRTDGSWEACTSGPSGGDHWYICANDEAIAHISANDGYDEEQRKPNAELIAAAPKLLAALEAVEALHVAEGNGNCIACWDFNSDVDVKYPCPTVRAITEVLQ